MLVDDNIKISLTEQGYLMNYPYHMISISEMCEAFMNNTTATPGSLDSAGSGMFFDYYPCLGDRDTSVGQQLRAAYMQLVLSIQYYLLCRIFTDEETYPIPDWVYSYMVGSTISVNSDKRDIHGIIYPLGVDNIDDDFDESAELACLNTSTAWIQRSRASENIQCDPDLRDRIQPYLEKCFIFGQSLWTIYSNNRYGPELGDRGCLLTRPATMFGEPHVVKSIRLSQIQLGR